MYALGALSQHEARAFDAHLQEGCQICHAELTQFNQVVGALGTAAESVEPPGYVRDLLAVRIEKEAADAPPASGSVIRFPEKQPPVSLPQVPAGSKVSSVLPWAAAALLFIGLAYTFMSWRSERQSLRAALDQERAQASETSGQVVA